MDTEIHSSFCGEKQEISLIVIQFKNVGRCKALK